MPLTSSSFSHSVNFCHIKSNGLYPPFPQRPPRGADAAKDLCGRLTEQAGEQGYENDADERHAAARHELFHTKIGVKLCSMAGGGVSRNLWNFFRTAPAGTSQAVTCSTSGMGLRLK